MTVTAIIQARMNSSRFPGKVLHDLAGKPVLKHVIDRVRQAETVEQIVVATAGPGCEAIVGHCEEWGVRSSQLYLLKEQDVLKRFVFASATLKPTDLIVRVCGDNPLIVPSSIDALVVKARETKADYAGYRNVNKQPMILYPTGYFAEVVTVAALWTANGELESDHPAREHVTQVIYASGNYHCAWLPVPDWYWDDRCPPETAIDTPADLERVAELLEEWDEYDVKHWPFK